jgi:pimeloyl-ACP methyl ester carboxylesterase
MPVDLKLACRMAKASDVCYYIGATGGLTSCPVYNDVGFTDSPRSFTADMINAAIVGATKTEVVVAFRGTQPVNTADWNDFIETIDDWVHDGEALLVKVPYAQGLVHKGFSTSLESLWTAVVGAVREQLTATRLPLVVAGHSKGGALATLAALRLRAEGVATAADVYTFGSPRVGDTPFSNAYDAAISQWRFENNNDLVPHLPPAAQWLDFLGQVDRRLSGITAYAYLHVGTLEFLDSKGVRTEGNSLKLQAQRMLSVADLLVTGRITQVATDHSVSNQYMPKICALG